MYELEPLGGLERGARPRASRGWRSRRRSVGADAVVGVEIAGGSRLTEGTIEYAVIGTAVRRGPRRRAAKGGAAAAPVLTELSVPDYAKLHAGRSRDARRRRLDLASSSCSRWTAAQLGGASACSMRNQELDDYTQGVYERARAVMARVTGAGGQRRTPSGVVGMRIDHTAHPGGNAQSGLIVSFDAIGTAIRAGRRHAAQPQDDPRPDLRGATTR